jgi:hypothetical protein
MGRSPRAENDETGGGSWSGVSAGRSRWTVAASSRKTIWMDLAAPNPDDTSLSTKAVSSWATSLRKQKKKRRNKTPPTRTRRRLRRPRRSLNRERRAPPRRVASPAFSSVLSRPPPSRPPPSAAECSSLLLATPLAAPVAPSSPSSAASPCERGSVSLNLALPLPEPGSGVSRVHAVGQDRLELSANGLRVRCSTN